MSIHLGPCPKCRGKHIGVTASAIYGKATFNCHTCGYIAYYQHCAKDEPFANAAKEWWDNLTWEKKQCEEDGWEMTRSQPVGAPNITS